MLMIDSPNKTCFHINIYVLGQCSRPFKKDAGLDLEANNQKPMVMVEEPDNAAW